MSPASQSLDDLFDTVYREARSAFGRKDIDISVTRDMDADEDDRYVARVLLDHTLAIAHGPNPAEALDALQVRIIKLAKQYKREIDECDAAFAAEREARAKANTIPEIG